MWNALFNLVAICGLAACIPAHAIAAGGPGTPRISSPTPSATPTLYPSPNHGSPAPVLTNVGGGALYDVPPHPLYNDFVRAVGAKTVRVRGHIESYMVASEKINRIPSASFYFIPEGNVNGIIVQASYPLHINGRIYECLDNTSSEFARRFHVCPALPSSVMGTSHPVNIEIYNLTFPAVSPLTWQATDTITAV